jgi:hypothetical protein
VQLELNDANDYIQLGLTLLATLGLVASTLVSRGCHADWNYARATRERLSIRQLAGEQWCQELCRVLIHVCWIAIGLMRLTGLYDVQVTTSPTDAAGLATYLLTVTIRATIAGQSLLRWWSRGRVLALERAARRAEAEQRQQAGRIT